MIYVKSTLAGVAALSVSAGMLLFAKFAFDRHSLGWGAYIDLEPAYLLIPLLFFAAGCYWEFRRAARKSA